MKPGAIVQITKKYTVQADGCTITYKINEGRTFPVLFLDHMDLDLPELKALVEVLKKRHP